MERRALAYGEGDVLGELVDERGSV